MAPSKTPEPIIRKLSEILIKMADDPEVKEAMRRAGADTVKTTPEEYRAPDSAGDCAVEAVDRGDRTEEMIVWLAAGEGLPDAQRAYCAGGRGRGPHEGS